MIADFAANFGSPNLILTSENFLFAKKYCPFSKDSNPSLYKVKGSIIFIWLV